MASLLAAQEALASGAWSRADSAFRAVIEESGDPLAHEGLAQVAWWTDDAETCLSAREMAYRLWREQENALGAARAATALAWPGTVCSSDVGTRWPRGGWDWRATSCSMSKSDPNMAGA